MNKIESLQEKYDSKKNDMSKEELLEFNEHLFKSFLSDKKANDDVFWAYSEITDRVIEDLEEKNALLINVRRLENKGDRGYINKLELEIELNRVTEDNERLEKDIFEAKRYIERLENMLSVKSQTIVGLNAELKKEKSLSDKLRYQVKSREQAIKEQRGIVIDEVVKLLDKEVGNFTTFAEWMSVKKLVVLKNKIKEMGNK